MKKMNVHPIHVSNQMFKWSPLLQDTYFEPVIHIFEDESGNKLEAEVMNAQDDMESFPVVIQDIKIIHPSAPSFSVAKKLLTWFLKFLEQDTRFDHISVECEGNFTALLIKLGNLRNWEIYEVTTILWKRPMLHKILEKNKKKRTEKKKEDDKKEDDKKEN